MLIVKSKEEFVHMFLYVTFNTFPYFKNISKWKEFLWTDWKPSRIYWNTVLKVELLKCNLIDAALSLNLAAWLTFKWDSCSDIMKVKTEPGFVMLGTSAISAYSLRHVRRLGTLTIR